MANSEFPDSVFSAIASMRTFVKMAEESDLVYEDDIIIGGGWTMKRLTNKDEDGFYVGILETNLNLPADKFKELDERVVTDKNFTVHQHPTEWQYLMLIEGALRIEYLNAATELWGKGNHLIPPGLPHRVIRPYSYGRKPTKVVVVTIPKDLGFDPPEQGDMTCQTVQR